MLVLVTIVDFSPARSGFALPLPSGRKDKTVSPEVTTSKAQELRTILSAIVGSKAHGTDTAQSDTDVRGVFLQPTSVVLAVGNYQKFIENPGADENAWELSHFIYLALRNNPFTLEALVAPPQFASPEGNELRSLFPHFLSRKLVFAAYRGFAIQQRKRMLDPNSSSQRRPKAMAHYLRVMFNGVELLRTGRLTVRIVDTEIGETVLAAKQGRLGVEKAIAVGDQLESDLASALAASVIPEAPNKTAINEFLLRVRKANW